MIKLVLLRHGESQWNLQNRFTGWTDVDLTPKGVKEAQSAGRILKEKGYIFDVAFLGHSLDLVSLIGTSFIILSGY